MGMSVCVKQANMPLDLPVLAFALSEIGFMRTGILGAALRIHPYVASGHLGLPGWPLVEKWAERHDFLVDRITSRDAAVEVAPGRGEPVRDGRGRPRLIRAGGAPRGPNRPHQRGERKEPTMRPDGTTWIPLAPTSIMDMAGIDRAPNTHDELRDSMPGFARLMDEAEGRAAELTAEHMGLDGAAWLDPMTMAVIRACLHVAMSKAPECALAGGIVGPHDDKAVWFVLAPATWEPGPDHPHTVKLVAVALPQGRTAPDGPIPMPDGGDVRSLGEAAPFGLWVIPGPSGAEAARIMRACWIGARTREGGP
jgi:hypothetical protein